MEVRENSVFYLRRGTSMQVYMSILSNNTDSREALKHGILRSLNSNIRSEVASSEAIF